jgi:hypothetical protein
MQSRHSQGRRPAKGWPARSIAALIDRRLQVRDSDLIRTRHTGTTDVGEPANRCCPAHLAPHVSPRGRRPAVPPGAWDLATLDWAVLISLIDRRRYAASRDGPGESGLMVKCCTNPRTDAGKRLARLEPTIRARRRWTRVGRDRHSPTRSAASAHPRLLSAGRVGSIGRTKARLDGTSLVDRRAQSHLSQRRPLFPACGKVDSLVTSTGVRPSLL